MKFAQVINVYIVPLLVILAGILLALKRRSQANAKVREKEHSDDL
jgi:hypothetical protein